MNKKHTRTTGVKSNFTIIINFENAVNHVYVYYGILCTRRGRPDVVLTLMRSIFIIITTTTETVRRCPCLVRHFLPPPPTRNVPLFIADRPDYTRTRPGTDRISDKNIVTSFSVVCGCAASDLLR